MDSSNFFILSPFIHPCIVSLAELLLFGLFLVGLTLWPISKFAPNDRSSSTNNANSLGFCSIFFIVTWFSSSHPSPSPEQHTPRSLYQLGSCSSVSATRLFAAVTFYC